MALGIMFSFLSPGFAPDLSAYLFGNILTINQIDLWMLGILALNIDRILFICLSALSYILLFDREFARSQKIPVEIFEYVLMMFIALTIVACLRMVGIVLAISLLTIPQMTANLFTYSFKEDYLGVNRHRFLGLPRWIIYFLITGKSFGSFHHILLYPDLRCL